jgi:hypothetical protein
MLTDKQIQDIQNKNAKAQQLADLIQLDDG